MSESSSRNKCGIYKIHCVGNNRDYIGSAVKHLQRWNSHRSMLARGIHNNRHLQNAYKKYGKESFKYTLIEECSENQLVEREQYWIDSYDFAELMNSSPTASTSVGFLHSEETKKLLSDKAKSRENKHLKKYHFQKGQMAGEQNLFAGKKHSKETIQKLKEIQSNRTYKTGGHNKGVPMSEDVKLRVSQSVSNNRRVYGDEIEQKAIKLRKLGWTYKKIGEELGISLAQAHRMSKGKRSQKIPVYLDKK
ncbi:GIY-YIG nuclease family protein [Porticoccaceae bacterium]|nr:GIY-YIG nuclease family protein [Porticoccaceae bacterium]